MVAGSALSEAIHLASDVCDMEPIHAPEAIQPHGLLLGLDIRTLKLVTKSANVDSLGLDTSLGAPLSWLPPEIETACRNLDPIGRPECTLVAEVAAIGLAEFHCFIGSDTVFCEFEHVSDGPPRAEAEKAALSVEAAILAISRADTIGDLSALTVEAVRTTAGFERVLVYRFDENGDGEVIGESLVADLPQSFLGLRFPASDIPAQARELYRLTESRWLPSRDYEAVSLIPERDSAGLQFDLGRSQYRSVSPIHRIYQKNIGVDGAMSVSVIHESALWGLVIGHNRHPHHVPNFRRRQVLAIVRAFNMRLDALYHREAKLELERETQACSGMLRKLAAAEDFLAALSEGNPSAIDLFPDCVGAAVVWDDDGNTMSCSIGQAPPQDELVALADWICSVADQPVFVTDRLSERLPQFLPYRETASGVLACLFDDHRHPTLLLFRPEVVQSVSWAGRPEKLAGPDGIPNLPRRSFDRWTEIRRGQSRPWQPWEVEVARTICAAVNDVIVRQARRVMAHKSAEAAIRRSEELLRGIFDTSNVGIFLVDPQGRITHANDHMANMFGYESDAMIGTQYVNLVNPTERETALTKMVALTKGEMLRVDSERSYLRQDGVEFWGQLTGRTLLDGCGKAIGLVGVILDITERKEAEVKLRQAHDLLEQQATELARSNEELEQFAYVASHDLRQPLRMITSYMSKTENRLAPLLDDDTKEFIQFAVGGAKRMDRLIVDLLAYSRTGQGARLEPVALADIVSDALVNLTVAIEEADAEVIVAEGLPTINGDRMELTRLFQNLIGNAVKYRAPGRQPRIEVGSYKQAGEWLIVVKDNGIGIAPEDRHRAFAIFKRLVAQDAYEGTGIGLAVCKKIVEQHGGRIWIDSPQGDGTTFTFSLPAGLNRGGRLDQGESKREGGFETSS